MGRFGHTNKYELTAGFELEEGAGLPLNCGFALAVSLAVVLLGCQDEALPSRRAKGVCEALRGQGVPPEAAGPGPSTITGREGSSRERHRRRAGFGKAIKNGMALASATVFSRLNMDVPPGLALAIHTRSQSEVVAGRLRVSVDHVCPASDGDPCRIRIHVRNSGFVPGMRRRRM